MLRKKGVRSYRVKTLHDVLTTVVSEKNGTFICELILECYKYLRNTQKRLEITNYVRNKSFLEIHLFTVVFV